MTLPDRLVAELINTRTGCDHQAPGGSDRARRRTCPRCGRGVLVGLDDSIAAFTATIDPEPINCAQEFAALISGRATYRLHAHAGELRIRRRSHWQITRHPAGTVHTVTDHTCTGDRP